MTSEEILKKAIEKAKQNGYEYEYNTKAIQYNFYYYAVIFSHEFAEKFWGKFKHEFHSHGLQGHFDRDVCDCGEEEYLPTEYHWQYHLQQMVLEPEPLKYIEKFL